MEITPLEEMAERGEDVIASFINFPKLAKRSYHTPGKLSRKDYLPILQFLASERTNYYFQELSDAVHVSENILRKWQEEIRKNPQFNPKDVKNTNKRNRKLSDELEDIMIQFIEKYYLNPGYYFDNTICRGVCYKIWLLRAKGEDREKEFKASKNWATRFMHKYGYSLRKAHAKRRPGNSMKFATSVRDFYVKIHALYQQHLKNNTLHLLVNADETSWKIGFRGELTYAKIGADNVNINDAEDTKSCLTSIATITADTSKKLPLCIIGKGKTERCCKSFSIPEESGTGIFFSPTGCAKESVIIQRSYHFNFTNINLSKYFMP